MTDPNRASEGELIERIRTGDEEAFIQLYRQRQGAIYRFALQMSGSESLAEDVTQEVFLALMREAGHFDSTRGSLAAYLYGIARNLVADHLRRRQMDSPLAQDESEASNAPPIVRAANDPLAEMTRREAVESLRQAVLALPEHYREVVVLCELHEMDYERAAKVLGCAVGTVRSRLHRARELLAKKLRGKDKDAAGEIAKALKVVRCAT
ncbi:MAG TPA: sigma-70 family RNA polymerase sigma factor [Terriglobia bacterium]|nr:sigma-70 family RNA polymerase sigma factor [Terriglobia bacterium]